MIIRYRFEFGVSLNGNINCILKMQSLFAIFFCVFYGTNAQTTNAVATLTLAPPPQSNWEEFTTSHQSVKETTKANKDKLACVLNLLKSALSEELANSQLQITEETVQEPHSSLSTILEEEQNRVEKEDDHEKLGFKSEKDGNAEKALYQKVINKIALAFSNPQNVSSSHNNVDMPSMIPIFKPRQKLPTKTITQNAAEFNSIPTAEKSTKSRAVAFVPEKIVQTNINSIPNQPMFNIPCQRAADVLDMNIGIPKEVCGNEKPNLNSVIEAPKPNLPTQIPAPVTLSVNCADSEDTVAMLFKPKNISLMQMYGNLLKKITITVLVPYHMSKLGSK